MPISKPVKKQKIILPSPESFYQMPLETKEMILRRLSTDNLILYMDQLVKGKNNRREAANCVTLEQIVDEDGQLESGGTPVGGGLGAYVAIHEWVTRNAALFQPGSSSSGGGGGSGLSGNFDLEPPPGFPLAMHSTQAINQTLLSSASSQQLMKNDLRRYGGSGGNVGHQQQQPQQNAFNLSAMSANLPSVADAFSSIQAGGRSGNRSSMAPTLSSYAPLRNIWDSVPNNNNSSGSNSSGGSGGDPGSGNNRWPNSLSTLNMSGAYHRQWPSSSSSSAALDAPGPSSQATGIDFRSGVETPVLFHSDAALGPCSNAATNANISPLRNVAPGTPSRPTLMMGLSPGKAPSKDREYIPAANAIQAKVKSLWESNYSSGSAGQGPSRWQQTAPAVPFKAAVERPSGLNNGQPSHSQQQQPKQSSASLPFSKDTFSSCSSSSSSSTKVGGGSGGAGGSSSSKGLIAGVEEMLSMQGPLEPDFLRAHNLPTPEAFNELNEEAAARLLANLPRNVRNKYEYHCWTCKLNHLLAIRPQIVDEGGEEGGDGNGNAGDGDQ